MSNKSNKNLDDMSIDELKKELEFVKECMEDEEQILNFMLHKTSLHLGGAEVKAMQEEYEENRSEYLERIKEIESLIRQKGHVDSL
ncbi:hypothetical protein JZK55_08760 [Dissulfurispira thermophila]|uniref:Uncharacterized protein n=2 Tax=root TaxID=1 RepID=A0A7G1GZW8_9BACT|nr:hypothetical protein [Dissulfurispira thermophila]BCB95954.1 hypothetical protein JZK55_08760 [Dissulfurispira thermophila]